MKAQRKTALVILFNHNYEKNIPILKRLYRDRFACLKLLMPFYYGDDEDVIPVYGNSFTFHSFIAQAREKLLALECDDYLIIGDDLLLNPELNSDNIHEKLSIEGGSFYIDGVADVSKGEYYRPVYEASCFSPNYPGLDKSANRCLPSYEDAFTILKKKGVISSSTLSKWTPYYPSMKKWSLKTLYSNYKTFRGWIWHFLKVLKYKFNPVKMPYPYVFGYSDIVLIPREKMNSWCNYLEVFATWRMFVEMAIPTAIMLVPDAKVVFSDKITYKTGNVFYPQSTQHYNKISAIIEALHNNATTSQELLVNFPSEYLYLHPVKLSKYKE